MGPKLRAAVVGLGKAGSRFDEEKSPPRWSHAGAYLALADTFDLVGGADPSADARDRFRQRAPHAKTYDDPVTMVAELRPDVVSVCTHPGGRGELVARLLAAHAPRVMLCEKPLELDAKQREAIVALCREAGTALAVNYTRRFETAWQSARAAIDAGRIGRVVSITIRAPNRIWSIGSHAIDTLTYLAGRAPTRWDAVLRPSLVETEEPAADVLFAFPDDVVGHLVTTGMRHIQIFEGDVIGTEGRLQVLDNGARTLLTRFEAFSSFGSAMTKPADEIARRATDFSPFVVMAEEVARVAHAKLDATSSNGANAVVTEGLVETIASLATSTPRRSP